MTELKTKRQKAVFPLANLRDFKDRAVQWANEHSVFCLLDNNGQSSDLYHRHDCLLAVGVDSQILHTEAYGAFRNLEDYYEAEKDWLFGFLAYDLKNDTERLSSSNFDGLEIPELHFFSPTYILEISDNKLSIHSKGLSPELVFNIIRNTEVKEGNSSVPSLRARLDKQDYLDTIEKIREHIQLGDIYEMNFCQEFFAEDAEIDPLAVFQKLNQKTETPFASFYKLNNRYLLCASPERFLQKRGRKLLSQPIKGTVARGKTPEEDLQNKLLLQNDQKNRSENVMIVDLVRNDLARSCKAGSVKPEELFGIYGFENVWQMISTVSGELREDTHFVEAIKKAFPMGSMTGAPKIRSMELIEKYEKTKRGLYSGSVGYITPEGDFDFNVVIRSLLYNSESKYLSFQVGGAIVYDSQAEAEYEECLVKGKNIFEL